MAAYLYWGPTIDHALLVEDPQKTAYEGKANKVPTIIGSNMNEGTLFTILNINDNYTVIKEWITQTYGVYANQILQIYPLSQYQNPYWLGVEIITDSLFRCPTRRS